MNLFSDSAVLLAQETWTLTQADLAAYAWVSGDINPIHFSEAAARELGLPSIIVHGLFAQSKITALLEQVAERDQLGRVSGSHTKFSAMMPAPGTYVIEVARGNAGTLLGRVQNSEGITCVEVCSTLT